MAEEVPFNPDSGTICRGVSVELGIRLCPTGHQGVQQSRFFALYQQLRQQNLSFDDALGAALPSVVPIGRLSTGPMFAVKYSISYSGEEELLHFGELANQGRPGMATRAEKKKTRKKQKRNQRKRQRQREAEAREQRMPPVRSGNSPYRQRLARQKPRAWEGEPPEDVAVFDDNAQASLSGELAAQAIAVREALLYTGQSRGEEALERVSAIGRSSPFSQWRLYIRGLVSWMADDFDKASEAWRRLDFERRPGRMATAMMVALQTDLDRVHAGQLDAKSTSEWVDRCDETLLYHAKLLRRIRFDRAAIRIAEKGARVPDELRKLKLGPKKLDWLKDFAAEYRDFEPDLVETLEQVALHRAFVQPYADLFEDAVAALIGPRHDRKNALLRFHYYGRFANDQMAEKRAENSLERYLTKELPASQELSEPLRNALISQAYLNEAASMIKPHVRGMMGRIFGQEEDAHGIREHLKNAARAYPANRGVYRTHVQWIESKLDDDRLAKPQRKPLLNEQTRVMQAWAKGLPDDVEPRLWLVDQLLENEQTEEARPHVEWLAASRQDDPRVRAAPWKWQLLEAMRLCRRKAWLGEVPARLDEAAAIWPAWLSPVWLPYLYAAASLRGGKIDEYDQQRQQIVDESNFPRDSLPDACMMLAAAQRMRVPAADLKTLRAPVDTAVKNIDTLHDDELLRAGGFFWDLQRTQLLYPAYRMHGSKFAKEAWSRFEERPKMVPDRLDDPAVQAAVLWCSEHRFFSDGYELRLPNWFDHPAIKKHPMFAAAELNAYLKLRVHWRDEEYSDLGPRLREAAQTESDTYYRYWFEALAEQFDEMVAAESKRSGFMGGFFGEMFGGGFDDDDDSDEAEDDELFDELGFDPQCDCPSCTAARKAYEARR